MLLRAEMLTVVAFGIFAGCDAPESVAAVSLADVEGCENVLDWSPEGTLLEDRVIERINEERRTGGRCGDRTYAPQGPIERNAALHCAARLHSLDMVTDNYVGFVAPDEIGLLQRLEDVGYDYAIWAASIGAGWTVADNAVDSWLGDESQCWKLFAAELTGVGIGVVMLPEPEFEEDVPIGEEEDPVPAHRSYWTLLVGAEVD